MTLRKKLAIAAAVIGVAVCIPYVYSKSMEKEPAASAQAGDGLIAQLPPFGIGGRSSRRNPYDLRILGKVAYHIEEDYVDPARVKPEKLLSEALDSLQRSVPEINFLTRCQPGVTLPGGDGEPFRHSEMFGVCQPQQVVGRRLDVRRCCRPCH